MKLGPSYTSAIEVGRWLDKWGIPAVVNSGTAFGATVRVNNQYTMQKGDWVVVNGEDVRVLLDSEYNEYYGTSRKASGRD